ASQARRREAAGARRPTRGLSDPARGRADRRADQRHDAADGRDRRRDGICRARRGAAGRRDRGGDTRQGHAGELRAAALLQARTLAQSVLYLRRGTGAQMAKTKTDQPGDLKYAETHEWARIEGTQAMIGISDYAQDELAMSSSSISPG